MACGGYKNGCFQNQAPCFGAIYAAGAALWVRCAALGRLRAHVPHVVNEASNQGLLSTLFDNQLCSQASCAMVDVIAPKLGVAQHMLLATSAGKNVTTVVGEKLQSHRCIG